MSNKINNTEKYPNTTPARDDHVIGTDVSNKTNDSGGETVTFTLGDILDVELSSANITGGTIAGITDLAVADGGTGSSTAAGARANLNVDAAGTDNSTDVTLAGTGTYLSIAGQVITVDPITESDISDLSNYQVQLAEGAFVDGDKTKLNGIETGATADQTAGEIKTAYESNTNTNAFTDSEQTKLTGIEANADVTDTANVTAAGALMDSEVINLAAVKSFDPADYATGTEGDLAATALQPGDAVEQTSATGSAVLPVGTTAQRDGTPATGYLRYNSTDGSPEVYDGSGWAAVGGGGGGGLVWITSSDLSSDATADFTAFDATKYDAYQFMLKNVSPASNNVSLHLLTSTDGGVSFDNASSNYIWTSPRRENTTDSRIVVAQNVADAVNSEGGINGTIQLYGPQVAKRTVFTIEGAYFKSGGFDNFAITSLAGTRRLDSDVDAVRFLFSSGNIASGTITMYGMVNA